MKTVSKFGLLLALAGSMFLSSCAGDYYVSDQPVEPVYDRPAAPYDGAVWIGGEWGWNGAGYTYTNGYWDKPRAGHTYLAGSWAHTSRGYAWHKGGWR